MHSDCAHRRSFANIVRFGREDDVTTPNLEFARSPRRFEARRGGVGIRTATPHTPAGCALSLVVHAVPCALSVLHQRLPRTRSPQKSPAPQSMSVRHSSTSAHKPQAQRSVVHCRFSVQGVTCSFIGCRRSSALPLPYVRRIHRRCNPSSPCTPSPASRRPCRAVAESADLATTCARTSPTIAGKPRHRRQGVCPLISVESCCPPAQRATSSS